MVIAFPRLTATLMSVCGMSFCAVASATTTPTAPPALPQAVCWGHYSIKPSNTTTDTDRANIQALLDKAASFTGVVELSSGTFNLSAPLRMPSGVKLCTKNGAVLKWTGSSSASFAIENKPSAANIRISNLTFDGAGVSLNAAPSATIESNVFKNIQPIGLNDTQSVYGWFGIKLQDTANVVITNNTFWHVAGSAIQGWRVSGTSTTPSRMEGNWFGYVNQPIAMLDAKYVTVKGNKGFEIERMGVEFSREDVPGSAVVDFPGITVTQNQFANWRPFDAANCPPNDNNVCKERHNIIGLSLVHLTGATATSNILDCGSGCLGTSRGLGIEMDSAGVTQATGNVISDFKDGFSLHRGQDLTVSQNALFGVRNGISSTMQGSIDKLTIAFNQIEAAPSRQIANLPWGIGIAPQWDHAGEVIIDGNLIAYTTNASSSPAGGEFVGITVGQVRAGGKPGTIQNNHVVIEGSPVTGFDVYGIRLSGLNGSLQGTQVLNNWVVASAPPSSPAQVQGTALDGGWQDNGTQGVALKNNVFQALSKLNRYYANHNTNGVYTASGNLAINMTSTAEPLPNQTSPHIATGKIVTLPAIAITASVEPPAINATGTTTLKFTSTVGSASTGFNQSTWYRGDGTLATNVTSTSVIYSPGATRTVRDVVTNTDKALITSSRVVTQK